MNYRVTVLRVCNTVCSKRHGNFRLNFFGNNFVYLSIHMTSATLKPSFAACKILSVLKMSCGGYFLGYLAGEELFQLIIHAVQPAIAQYTVFLFPRDVEMTESFQSGNLDTHVKSLRALNPLFSSALKANVMLFINYRT